MERKPQYSIIVPIYNVQVFLKQCIESILNQSYTNFELILVNDGSTDKSPQICNQYAKLDERIVVIHKKNGGLVSARNAGVAIAKGEYIGYVDGDDWVTTDWLESIQDIVEKYNPDIINFNAYKSVNGNNSILRMSQFEGLYKDDEIKCKIFPNMLYNRERGFYTFGILPAIWSKLIRAEILKENICKEEKITFGEDAACAYSCLLQCQSYYGLKKSLYYYRQNNQAMTKSYDMKRFERINILFQYFEENILNKNECIKNQYSAYKLFCLFYAILNESKSNETISKIASKCYLEIQPYEHFIKKFNIKNLSFFWKLFYWIVRNKHYKSAITICKVIVKIKYSYKE